ncbi:MAG: DUF5615 family PIN-like protein [Chloroflexota bacterium]
MQFLVDECTGPAVARWLRQQGFAVFSVFSEARGMSDDEILNKAFVEDWIIITNDKDFGEKVYRERSPHRGVIFLRLKDERSKNKIAVLQAFLDKYRHQIAHNFVVVTEKRVRIRR